MFVHLQVHTEYSLIDSTIRPRALVARCRELEMPAVAITDVANTFGMVRFYEAAIHAGIKPVIGLDAWIQNVDNTAKPFRMTLLCQNLGGYQNLCRLLSRAYAEGHHKEYVTLSGSWLEGNTEGLIALSGGLYGTLGEAMLADHGPRLRALLEYYRQCFPERFYLEVSRIGIANEESCIALTVALAMQYSLPIVATNQVCFLNADDHFSHEIRTCIQRGDILEDPQRKRDYTTEQYLKSPRHMQTLFADLPEALTNSVEISRRCNLQLDIGHTYLPAYPDTDGLKVGHYHRLQAEQGLELRLGSPREQSTVITKAYWQRLDTELAVIEKMGFDGYFLIVADIVSWAKQQNIPVGPGRGSGAGSLVAYALKITDVDPLAYDLLFERFLNPERVSMPDFDIDICMDNRDRVIDYIGERYGREKVSQIVTHGTMAARAVVRDVGRVLGLPYGFVDRVAKLIPFGPGVTLEKSLLEEQELRDLYESDEEVQQLLDRALPLEGLTRNVGKHAGGVVIAPTELTDFTPLYRESPQAPPITHLDKVDIEKIGLVKFDFLGLRTLTILDWTVNAINESRRRDGKPELDLSQIDLSDKKTYELIRKADTIGVFQLEGSGVRGLIRKLRPDSFEDVISAVALYRPGPLGSGIPNDFVRFKHGEAPVTYLHPKLEPVLKPTYGVIIYQEQVMQISQVLAGYSLGEADLLRRAMGKKDEKIMQAQRSEFIQGATRQGVERGLADHIFGVIEQFAKYGFNKSHSVAYGLIAFQTAWLKAHYPAYFMAATMSSTLEQTETIKRMLWDCQEQGILIAAPDINHSQYHFTALSSRKILYGLGAIKGLGGNAIENITAARDQGGEFLDLDDLCCRVDHSIVNRRGLLALIKAGALGCLSDNRAGLVVALEGALSLAEQRSRDHTTGQVDLFGTVKTVKVVDVSRNTPPWGFAKRLEEEKSALGLYLSDHPMAKYRRELSDLVPSALVQLSVLPKREVTVAGCLESTWVRSGNKGSRAGLLLDDGTARLEVTCSINVYDIARNWLTKGRPLVVSGSIREDRESGKPTLRGTGIYSLEEARLRFATVVEMIIDVGPEASTLLFQLRKHLSPYKGGNSYLRFQLIADDFTAIFDSSGPWRIRLEPECLSGLRQLLTSNQIKIHYQHQPLQYAAHDSVPEREL